ncbi:hypothetical protein BLOT_015062 [Blomia tropicalis]|nr:hypothetical protein BLOT_015062 [Blomia tropicalis]
MTDFQYKFDKRQCVYVATTIIEIDETQIRFKFEMASCSQRRLPENTVEYHLLPYIDRSDNCNDVRKQLDDFNIQYSGHLARYLTDYIWHKDPFILRCIVNESDGYLYGRTTFEDNIEDEYFIMFLLYQLTLFDSKLVVKITDEDGEILLIECANYLDRWAQDPRRSENRVYLFNGEIHLISPVMKSSWANCDSNNYPIEAAQFIRDNSDRTKANDSIQRCIGKLFNEYPDKIIRQQHRAHCYLPISIASLLDHNPKYIAHSVRAFYFRTPDEEKSINSMKHFPGDKCLLSSIRFTRCLFAQLTSQEYRPKIISNGWSIPSTDSSSYRAYINGFKIAAGFEILVSRYERNKANHQTEKLADKLENNVYWKRFFSCLESNGFFGQEMVGSMAYCQQLDKCKLYFQQMLKNLSQSIENEIDIGKYVLDYITTLNIDEEFNKKKSATIESEDDDDWLTLDMKQLDDLLSKKFGCNPDVKLDMNDISKTIPETIKNFVFNEDSGLKGAEAPKNKSKQRKENKIKVDENEIGNFMKEIQFLVDKELNVNDFIDSDSSTSSSLEDYGSDNGESDASYLNAIEIEKSSISNHENNPEINAYLKQMDSELAKTAISRSFKIAQFDSDDDADDECDNSENEPQIDLNVLSNILESYNAESEMSTSVGPATTLFATMGTKLPDVKK